MKILIVEDEIALLHAIVDSLAKEHFVIETASDFHAASEKINV